MIAVGLALILAGVGGAVGLEAFDERKVEIDRVFVKTDADCEEKARAFQR